MAIVDVVQIFWIERTKNNIATVTSSVTPCLAPLASNPRRSNVVHIMVEDVQNTAADGATECEAHDSQGVNTRRSRYYE